MKKLNLTLALLLFGAMNFTFAQENSISENGNVGIGTTNPNAKLDVHGRVNIDSTLVVKDSVTIESSMRVMGESTFEDARFGNVDITGDLNVSGATKLNSDIQFTSLAAIADMTGKTIAVMDASGNLKKIPYDSMAYSLKSLVYATPQPLDPCMYTLGTNPNWASLPNKLFVACPDVRVGIGTYNPQTNLDVQGTTYTKRFALNADPGQLGTKYFHMKVTETSPSYQNAPVFLIENNDRPLLQVNNNGILRSREVILDLNTSWPDYVFQTDYKLLEYDELRSYISENGHLPNVPSALEMEKTGIEVGNTQTIMMEKIEELTLYILELEQRIKTLEAENKN